MWNFTTFANGLYAGRYWISILGIRMERSLIRAECTSVVGRNSFICRSAKLFCGWSESDSLQSTLYFHCIDLEPVQGFVCSLLALNPGCLFQVNIVSYYSR